MSSLLNSWYWLDGSVFSRVKESAGDAAVDVGR